jgi:hypothetical protein
VIDGTNPGSSRFRAQAACCRDAANVRTIRFWNFWAIRGNTCRPNAARHEERVSIHEDTARRTHRRAYYQTRSSLTKAEIEIVTNLVNGRWLSAYANYEHEKIAEKAGGLPPEKVEALIAGLPTSFDEPRQQVVYELASALVEPRVVPLGLYRRAKAVIATQALLTSQCCSAGSPRFASL